MTRGKLVICYRSYDRTAVYFKTTFLISFLYPFYLLFYYKNIRDFVFKNGLTSISCNFLFRSEKFIADVFCEKSYDLNGEVWFEKFEKVQRKMYKVVRMYFIVSNSKG